MSESIVPAGGWLETGAMASGEPGLPRGFDWRGARYDIQECLSRWKELGPDSAGGSRYLRRHGYELRMSDRSTWIVYCLRAPSGKGVAAERWFLKTRAGPPAESRS